MADKHTIEKTSALIEAILYLEIDPIDLSSLARISGLSKDLVKKAVDFYFFLC